MQPAKRTTGLLERKATEMSDTVIPAEPSRRPTEHGISFMEAFKVWLRVAALSFGGPAGQIAVMHRIVVD